MKGLVGAAEGTSKGQHLNQFSGSQRCFQVSSTRTLSEKINRNQMLCWGMCAKCVCMCKREFVWRWNTGWGLVHRGHGSIKSPEHRSEWRISPKMFNCIQFFFLRGQPLTQAPQQGWKQTLPWLRHGWLPAGFLNTGRKPHFLSFCWRHGASQVAQWSRHDWAFNTFPFNAFSQFWRPHVWNQGASQGLLPSGRFYRRIWPMPFSLSFWCRSPSWASSGS